MVDRITLLHLAGVRLAIAQEDLQRAECGSGPALEGKVEIARAEKALVRQRGSFELLLNDRSHLERARTLVCDPAARAALGQAISSINEKIDHAGQTADAAFRRCERAKESLREAQTPFADLVERLRLRQVEFDRLLQLDAEGEL